MSENPRDVMIELVTENRARIEGNLCAFFHRNAEDFIAGGVDAEKVRDALFAVAVVHKVKGGGRALLKDLSDMLTVAMGVENAAALLRESAAMLEARAREKPADKATAH